MSGELYWADDTWFRLEISMPAKEQFLRFCQRGARDLEAGGQLYTRNPVADIVSLDYASPPRGIDVRGRTTFVLDAKSAEAERRSLFEQGYHCIGLWHTHPERNPEPSSADIQVMREWAGHAIELNTFLHIIVGIDALWVGACNRDGVMQVFSRRLGT